MAGGLEQGAKNDQLDLPPVRQEEMSESLLAEKITYYNKILRENFPYETFGGKILVKDLEGISRDSADYRPTWKQGNALQPWRLYYGGRTVERQTVSTSKLPSAKELTVDVIDGQICCLRENLIRLYKQEGRQFLVLVAERWYGPSILCSLETDSTSPVGVKLVTFGDDQQVLSTSVLENPIMMLVTRIVI